MVSCHKPHLRLHGLSTDLAWDCSAPRFTHRGTCSTKLIRLARPTFVAVYTASYNGTGPTSHALGQAPLNVYERKWGFSEMFLT